MSNLLNSDLTLASVASNSNRMIPAVTDHMALPSYSIDDLLTPNSSLTNVTSLPAADTTRSLLAGHDGLTGNINNTTHTLSPSASATNPLPNIDPLHGLLLGNTTAFDSVTTQGQDHHPHISAAAAAVAQQQQQTVPINTGTDSTTLHIKGISQSPFDLDDKEVAESMSCTTNYPLQFEGIPNEDEDEEEEDEGDTVFMPIKSNDDDEPVNGNPDSLLSPTKYGNSSLWSKSCHSGGESPMKGLNVSNRQPMDDFSDPTETSDKDDDSTADEQVLHSRIKRRQGRSPSSSQIPLNIDVLHAIRELTHQLNESRSHGTRLTSETMPSTTARAEYDEKLERCCQRLEQLTVKVDRLLSLEQTAVPSRPSRPSPSTAPVEVISSAEPQVSLSDTQYDRLEAMLIEKIQTYVQGVLKSAFEPYRDLKDNLHKDLAAKLLATDAVIKQSITQIFRSKTMIDSLSNAVANAIQTTMITTYRDTFNQVVIPSFEKAATNMFQQTNDVFKRGTKEYLQEMIEYGRQQQRSVMQQREQMMNEIRKESSQLLKEIEKKNQEFMSSLKSDLLAHMTTQLDTLIRETIQTMLRTEMTTILRDLFAAQKTEMNALILQHLRQQQQQPQQQPPAPSQIVTPRVPVTTTSRTTTPLSVASTPVVSVPIVSSAGATPILDAKQQHILKLVHAGQYNQAFEFALSAVDLNLVLFLCEQVSPSELFAMKPFPLQVPVLLSLIHQLAANFNSHQELKLSYLAEGLLRIDPSNSTIHDHLCKVLIDLNTKLTNFMQSNPNPSPIITRHCQVLYATSQNLLKKIAQQRATPIHHHSSSTPLK